MTARVMKIAGLVVIDTMPEIYRLVSADPSEPDEDVDSHWVRTSGWEPGGYFVRYSDGTATYSESEPMD